MADEINMEDAPDKLQLLLARHLANAGFFFFGQKVYALDGTLLFWTTAEWLFIDDEPLSATHGDPHRFVAYATREWNEIKEQHAKKELKESEETIRKG